MIKTVEIGGDNPQFAASLLACFKDMGLSPADGNNTADMFVYIIDPPPCGRKAYADLLSGYQSTAIGLLEAVSRVLPRMDPGAGKRLCFINRLSSSVNLAGVIEGGFERIISAACNMAVKTLFNRLRPAGYTFRLYGVENFENKDECSYIADYFIRNRSLEAESPIHSDENRLVIRSRLEIEYPW
ncbi:MAG: hypothetical protein LBP42_01245 [Treponema sp.]|jgi:hypothetical protein|nr:hypothetical protein [Treponema sp.]